MLYTGDGLTHNPIILYATEQLAPIGTFFLILKVIRYLIKKEEKKSVRQKPNNTEIIKLRIVDTTAHDSSNDEL